MCFWLCLVFVAVHMLSLVAASRGCSVVVVCGLLIVVPSLVAEHDLWACGLSSCCSKALKCSIVVAHRLSCPTACEIFLDQRLNPYPLHWQLDS